MLAEHIMRQRVGLYFFTFIQNPEAGFDMLKINQSPAEIGPNFWKTKGEICSNSGELHRINNGPSSGFNKTTNILCS
jgi:hypothetical protein